MVGCTLRGRDAKILNQSENKCSGCFEKLLISAKIFAKQQHKLCNINHQVASYKLLLNKTPLGWYLIQKDKKCHSKIYLQQHVQLINYVQPNPEC